MEDADDTGPSFSPDHPLSLLRLGYRAEWPCNVVLTDSAVASYGEIFAFLLQLRKAVWGLEQVFLHLKGLSQYLIFYLIISHLGISSFLSSLTKSVFLQRASWTGVLSFAAST